MNEDEQIKKQALIVKDTAKFFYEKSIKVHILTKNKWHYNGLIKQFFEDKLILDDRYGLIPIYFVAILIIQPSKKEELK